MITMMDTVTMSLNRIHIVRFYTSLFEFHILDRNFLRFTSVSSQSQEAKLGKNDGREGGEGGPILIDPWELKTDN